MALYRCASCGSPNVVTDTKHSGIEYNYKKAIAGAVVFGTGGAVAGVQSKTYTVYKCADCGMTLSYPMPNDLKVALEIGLASVEMRDKLTFSGLPVPWSFFTNTYVNMCGKGKEPPKEEVKTVVKDDSEEDDNYDIFKKLNVSFTDGKNKLESLVPIIKENLKVPLVNENNLKVLQAIWESSGELTREDYAQKKEEYLKELEELVNNESQKLIAIKDEKLNEIDNKNQELVKKRQEKQNTLYSLGLFKSAEKNVLKTEIEALSKEIDKNNQKKAECRSKFENDLAELEYDIKKASRDAIADFNERYKASATPKEQFEAVESFNLPPENPYANASALKNTLYNLILNIIKSSEEILTIAEITELIQLCGYEALGSFDDIKIIVTQFVRAMREKGVLEREEHNRMAYFKFNSKNNIFK